VNLPDPAHHANGDTANSTVNKVLVDRYHMEIFAQGKLEVADEILSRDFTSHQAGFPPDWNTGPEGVKQAATAMRRAFPNITFNHDMVFARGGKVVIIWTMTGIHEGEFLGISPTGRQIETTGTDIYWVSPTGPGGKIVEYWSNWDQWGTLRQLGAVPPAY